METNYVFHGFKNVTYLSQRLQRCILKRWGQSTASICIESWATHAWQKTICLLELPLGNPNPSISFMLYDDLFWAYTWINTQATYKKDGSKVSVSFLLFHLQSFCSSLLDIEPRTQVYHHCALSLDHYLLFILKRLYTIAQIGLEFVILLSQTHNVPPPSPVLMCLHPHWGLFCQMKLM